MFNHFNIKAVLYIIENQYTEVETGVFKQKRRSFPLETMFFDAFPSLYAGLLNYVQGRITAHKSEIRLCLVFKRYSKSKSIGSYLRIKNMKDINPGNAYEKAVDNEESVLFDETDNDSTESKVTYANKKQVNTENIYLPKSGDTESTMSSES
jgi:hypothetical protein